MNTRNRPLKIEKKYSKFKNPKEHKPKIHIDESYFMKFLIGIGLFVLIELIFLFIVLLSDHQSTLDKMVIKGTTMAEANTIYNISIYSKFAVDWCLMLVFAISVIVARRKIEIGYVFIYGWMFFMLAIVILPFAMPAKNDTSYIKLGCLVVPMLLIYFYLIQQANDLRWMRKAHTRSEKGKTYV